MYSLVIARDVLLNVQPPDVHACKHSKDQSTLVAETTRHDGCCEHNLTPQRVGWRAAANSTLFVGTFVSLNGFFCLRLSNVAFSDQADAI